MMPFTFDSRGSVAVRPAVLSGTLLSASVASPQKIELEPAAEKAISQSSPGPLFLRTENFPPLARAPAVAGPTSLSAEVVGAVWLFPLGPPGGSSPVGSTDAEIGLKSTQQRISAEKTDAPLIRQQMSGLEPRTGLGAWPDWAGRKPL